ncbi:MAG: DUF58 domain-containing protein [Gammaproteobacteria bacterium]|nr:MAG: DUF58 domain-containing protein [Gammaproteobacteria bacterium]
MSSIRWTFPSVSGLFPSIGAAATRRVQSWARNRQGVDPDHIELSARRTYILPTGVGMIYALMSFAMLMGSMNYNNNLSFLLTFLLIALGFVAMHQCQRNLVGLDVSFAGVEPVFAGQSSQFRIVVTNHSKSPRNRIRLYVDTTLSDIHDLEPGESQVFVIALATDKRGWVKLKRFGIRTLFPFELFRSWAWLHMDIRGLVYPKPLDDAPPPPASQMALGHRQHDARGEEDFAGLRRFVVGDSPRNVAWKAYARSGQLLSKQFSGADTSSQWFDFSEFDNVGVEERLSTLARWIIDADRTNEDYGLKMPSDDIAPAHGEAHRHRCLEALALYGLEHE